MNEEKVHYSELLPHEFRKRLKERPLAYLPLGTLEWHGEHMPLGSDAIISEALMVQCAREYGGIVMPPIHLGPDRAQMQEDGSYLVGMDYDKRTYEPRQLDGSCYWVPQGTFLILIDSILEQIRRAGFKAVFADGHGPSRNSWVANIPEREARFGLKLFGATPDVKFDWRSQRDHAARNETSQVMAARPELVDMTQLPEDKSIWPLGIAGEDPRGELGASPEYGRECFDISLKLMKQIFEKAGV